MVKQNSKLAPVHWTPSDVRYLCGQVSARNLFSFQCCTSQGTDRPAGRIDRYDASTGALSVAGISTYQESAFEAMHCFKHVILNIQLAR